MIVFPNAGLSPEEYLKVYKFIPPEMIDELLSSVDENKAYLEKLDKYYETVEEQLSFARELVTAIKESLDSPSLTKAKDLKKHILLLIEDSYLEL